ncbi:MAG: DUF4838 domain-containing protein [Verrucomicrobiota bacterium]
MQNCRKLDPVNGREISLLNCIAVPRHDFPYVSLTDRVLTFANRIAEGVSAEFPDKHLGFYAYSVYNAPPLSVKPHPNLIIIYVGTDIDDWNSWNRFDNQMFWRPNVLLAHRRQIAPMDFSRPLFDKFRHIYNHGLIGTDISTCHHQWALKGLAYYVLTKAHWNPNAVDFDALVNDYCRAGFGPAAGPIRDYFSALALISGDTSEKESSLVAAYTPERLETLQGCLDRAREAVRGQEDRSWLERVEFLQLGLDLATAQYDLHQNPDDANAKEHIRELLMKIYRENPLAVNAPLVAAYGKF